MTLDGDYEGEPPESELLSSIDCQNIMMVQRQGKGVETSVLMKEQNALETKTEGMEHDQDCTDREKEGIVRLLQSGQR